MHNIESVLTDFLERIGLATNINDMFAALERAAILLGFDNISYTYVPLVIGNNLYQLSPIFLVSQSYETRFISHYVSEKLGQDDFTIKRIQNGDMSPMNWWEEAKKKTLSHKEQRVIEIARNDYGIRHGITIPTYSNNNGIAGVSVTSSESNAVFSLLCKERLTTIKAISQIFSDRVLISPKIRQNFMTPFLQKLTDMEKNVLKKLSQGFAPKIIAYELNSSQKYVNNVIATLRVKFGNITRDQLLYAAGLMAFDELGDET